MPGEVWKRVRNWLNEPVVRPKRPVAEEPTPPNTAPPPIPATGFTQPPPADSVRKPRKSGKTVWWVLILGACGILCLALCDCSGGSSAGATASKTEEPASNAGQEQIQALCAAISGDPSAVVALTYAQEREVVYAYDEKQTSSGSEREVALYEDASGHDSGLVQTVYQAKVAGVAVVCRDGEDPTVRLRIMEAVSTALNITSDRVYVTASG